MVDKIEMSLDDIIKSNKGGSGGGRRGRGGGPVKRRGNSNFQQRSNNVGGVQKGRTNNRGGGITRAKYTRVRDSNKKTEEKVKKNLKYKKKLMMVK